MDSTALGQLLMVLARVCGYRNPEYQPRSEKILIMAKFDRLIKIG